ncbi:cinnamate beta-D-glucosyltransferase-like [Miscanthus floridulus]|uniref:cinnamate beta-D-glucosyltransferase-like n=1 Tax=Miscanthus floridulus TaxID=154761 RepID=UPI00345AA52E
MAEEVTPHVAGGHVHVLLICYPSQGHINPVPLAMCIAGCSSHAPRPASSATISPPPRGCRLVATACPSVPAISGARRKQGGRRRASSGTRSLPWVTDVAADGGISSAVLWVQSCAVFSHGLAEFPREDDLEGSKHVSRSRAS